MRRQLIMPLIPLILAGCASGTQEYDVIIRGGSIYDGSGEAPHVADIAIDGDSIVSIGDLGSATAPLVIDAAGRAVAPGFINMLSWATESLIEDGRSQSGIRQGVTLEVFGEGSSMGPLNDAMRERELEEQGDIRYDIPWTTLGEYLEHLETKGVATNVASFIGATTVRIHELGHEDREPTAAELDRMRTLVRHAMEEGALGVGSSLIYAPAFYAKTPELIALSEEA
ncbi:MAG: D-aminoacylase, partial [Gemmatimonadetes bacterium]|nr:D-aminoacylase [Gemmatimonadota bacterium]